MLNNTLKKYRDIYSGRFPLKKIEKQGRMRGKEKEEKREEKRGIGVKKEGQYPYFVFLFNIGPYDRKKKTAKEVFKKLSRGEGKNFLGGHIYT